MKKPAGTTQRRSEGPASVGLRRTLVPLLLTHGVFLPILGVSWFFTDDDSPFRRLGVAVPVLLIGTGAILLLFGILNMLYLKHFGAPRRTPKNS